LLGVLLLCFVLCFPQLSACNCRLFFKTQSVCLNKFGLGCSPADALKTKSSHPSTLSLMDSISSLSITTEGTTS
jgi:hypothetical protein